MQSQCNRAFKEWNAACNAMMAGNQTILIRKGGIREDGGRFVIDDSEFWLMPTFDHQNAGMLQPSYIREMANTNRANPDQTAIQAYAVVAGIWTANDDAQVNALQNEMIWNESFVKLRFDFNPYDPLFIVLLRVYRLSESVLLPMTKEYAGCKSWVTLDRSISTSGLIPAITDEDFAVRRAKLSLLMGPADKRI